MKMNAYVAGVGMTGFGRMMDRGLKSLGAEAIKAALFDAGVDRREVQAAWMSNAAAGVLTGQECIRGEVVLRSAGMGGLPVVNVENACASASTAFNQACAMVSAGLYDIVLACGVEKMYFEDRAKVFGAFMGAVDVEQLQSILDGLQKSAAASGASEASKGAGKNRSMFMDIYAAAARSHMQRFGTTAEQFAMVSAKNSFHGSLNPRAQFREAMTVEQVLASPMIATPLHRMDCCVVSDVHLPGGRSCDRSDSAREASSEVCEPPEFAQAATVAGCVLSHPRDRSRGPARALIVGPARARLWLIGAWRVPSGRSYRVHCPVRYRVARTQ